jgi:hypothetical protein
MLPARWHGYFGEGINQTKLPCHRLEIGAFWALHKQKLTGEENLLSSLHITVTFGKE